MANSVMEQLDLDFYTLDDALAYFKRNKPQIRTREHIFSLAESDKLLLSLKFKEAVLTPVSLQQEIDNFRLNPIDEKSLNIRGNYHEEEISELRKLTDQIITISNMCLPITEMVLDVSSPDKEMVTLVEYENQECKPTRTEAVGDYFNTDYIVITKANLKKFLSNRNFQLKQVEDETRIEERQSIEESNGIINYSIDAISKALAEKEYPDAKPFFDKHGYDDKDKEMAILQLANNWGKDIEKAIRNGSLSQYNTFGKRHIPPYYSEDGRVKEADINKWLADEGRTFKLECKQDKVKRTTVKKTNRGHQLHTLILKVDIALTNEGVFPAAQAVWNEIEENHNEYDDEAIIQEVKNNTIFWKSKGGIDQSLQLTSFSATLSVIRKKIKNN